MKLPKNITQRHDGDSWEINLNEMPLHNIICCDCGLAHTLAFAYEDGILGIAVEVNKELTEKMREK